MNTKFGFAWVAWLVLSLLMSACDNPYDTSAQDAPEVTVSVPGREVPGLQRVAYAVAPAYINTIAIAVEDLAGKTLGTGLISATGGALTFKVPVGVALTVKGAALDKSGANRFTGEAQVPPLRLGAKADVKLSLEPINSLNITGNPDINAGAVFIEENTTKVTEIPTNAASDQTVRYSLSGGADKDLFTITRLTGELSFITAPSCSSPADSNKDNVYEVQIEVTDEFETAVKDLKVTVLCPNVPPPKSTVGGTVSGLAGAGLVLRNNGGDDQAINAAVGPVTFAFTPILTGGQYNVTIASQPANPWQTCTLIPEPASGTIGNDPITVNVSCTTNSYAVSVNVTGMNPLSASGAKGADVVLRNNGADDLSILKDGVYPFASKVFSGNTFNVTVAAQPVNPAQTCVPETPKDTTITNAPVTVNVKCTTNSYTISGAVTGLAGTGFQLLNNTTPVTVLNGEFSATLPGGSTYNFTVGTQPSNPTQKCDPTAGASPTGTVGNANVSGIAFVCNTQSFAVGGTLSGLSTGTSLTLTNTLSGDSVVLSANGPYQMTMLSGTPYDISVTKKALGQTCTVSNGAGTVTSADISDVNVTCVVSNILRYSFVANYGDDSVSTYMVDANTGRTKYISSTATGGTNPTAIALDPASNFAYVTNAKTANISQFRIGVDGALSSITSPISTNSTGVPVSIVVDPKGQYVYVANDNGEISQYSIGEKGNLKKITSPVLTQGNTLVDLAIDPGSRFVYAVHGLSNDMSQLAIEANGALTLKQNGIKTGTVPRKIVFEASGQFFYIVNRGSNDIAGFTVSAAGDFKRIICNTTCSKADPTNFAAGGMYPWAAVTDPAGQYLFLTTNVTATTTGEGIGALVQYTIGKSGELVLFKAALTGSSATSVVVDPSGKFVYVGNEYTDDIYQYVFDETGAVAQNAPISVPGQVRPISLAVSSGTTPVQAMTKNVYVANYGSNSVSQLEVLGGGTLGALNPSSVGGVTAPLVVAVDPTGRYAYATNSSASASGTVSMYSIDGGGSLTSIVPTVPVGTGATPSNMTFHPSGRYAYIPNFGSSTVSQYAVGANGLLSVIQTDLAGASPFGVAIHPTGKFAYITRSGSNEVGQYTVVDNGSGAGSLVPLTTNPSAPAGVTPYGIAIDPTGRYAYVANYGIVSGLSTVSQYTIGSDGKLSPMTIPSVNTETAPTSIAVHPSGNYVYVTNLGSGSVSQYAVQADGSLVAMVPPTVATGVSPFSIAVDSSGRYAYVVNNAGTKLAGSVTQYLIGKTGELTPLDPAAIGVGLTPYGIATTSGYQ